MFTPLLNHLTASKKMFTPLFKSGSRVKGQNVPCGFGQSPIRLKEYFGKSENLLRKKRFSELLILNRLIASQKITIAFKIP
jgi:hypothetical protein